MILDKEKLQLKH